jgi:hypothetical protein
MSGKTELTSLDDSGRHKHHLPLVTTSELKALRKCKRKHHLGYRLGYREIHKAGPLRFGTAVHEGLEVWWSRDTLGDVEAALAAIDKSGEIDEFERAKARAMIVAYHARWIDADFEVVGVEVPFEAPLINPATGAESRTYRIGGKIDGILRQPNGDIWINEKKTAGEEIGLESVYWQRLKLDTQISMYYRGARALGYDVKGCQYDVLRKPAIRPKQIPLVDTDDVKIVLDAAGERVRTKDGKKWRETADSKQGYSLATRPETPNEFEARCLAVIAEEPDRYLMRGEVQRSEEDELDAAEDLWATVRELRESELARRWPRNPDSCFTWGRACEFFPVCTGQATLEDETLYRRKTAKHEELAV